MAFADGSSREKIQLVDYASKVSNMGRRLTHGSGCMTDETADIIDEQCLFLQGCLTQLGYSDGPEANQAIVTNGTTAPVSGADGNSVAYGTYNVSNSTVNSLDLPGTVAILTDGETSGRVQNSVGIDVSGACDVVVTGGKAVLKVPSNFAFVLDGWMFEVGGVKYTFTVSNGEIQNITTS